MDSLVNQWLANHEAYAHNAFRPDGTKTAIIISDKTLKGKGAFGSVYEVSVSETEPKPLYNRYHLLKESEATNLQPRQRVALKTQLHDSRYKFRELEILRSISHPTIARLLFNFTDKTEDPRSKDTINENSTEVFHGLVLEYMPLDLSKLLRSGKKLSPIEVKLYTYQLLRSLEYLHRRKICHRDIKPPNILVDPQTMRLKLCDFGSAKYMAPTAQSGHLTTTYICSRHYRAPELIFNYRDYGCEVDIWSAGCIVVGMFLRRPVFFARNAANKYDSGLQRLNSNQQEALMDQLGVGHDGEAAPSCGYDGSVARALIETMSNYLGMPEKSVVELYLSKPNPSMKDSPDFRAFANWIRDTSADVEGGPAHKKNLLGIFGLSSITSKEQHSVQYTCTLECHTELIATSATGEAKRVNKFISAVEKQINNLSVETQNGSGSPLGLSPISPSLNATITVSEATKQGLPVLHTKHEKVGETVEIHQLLTLAAKLLRYDYRLRLSATEALRSPAFAELRALKAALQEAGEAGDLSKRYLYRKVVVGPYLFEGEETQ